MATRIRSSESQTVMEPREYSGSSEGLGDGTVSVALCTYNGARYLSEQLVSIAEQTYPPAELVACDDGSSDDTCAILREFAKHAKFPVQVIQNPFNLGSTKNFEKAIHLCRGEFIALADQDDFWMPNKIRRLTQVISEESAGAAFSDGILMDEDSNSTGETLLRKNRLGNKFRNFESWTQEETFEILLRNNVVTGATLLFRSELRNLLTPFPENWIHDGWIAWMVALHSKLVLVSEPLIHYRVHRGQQLGVPAQSLERWQRAQSTDGPVYAALERQLYAALERQFGTLFDYAVSHPSVCSQNLCRRIKEKQQHMRFRAQLPPRKWSRWAKIAFHTSAYHSYAQGWLSMLKDGLI